MFKNISSKNDFDYLQSETWTKKELLYEEFKSLGFYMSDHPLNNYSDTFNQLKIISYKEFIDSNDSQALVAGTIMSFQEKKSAKGTPYGIVKFSDQKVNSSFFYLQKCLFQIEKN